MDDPICSHCGYDYVGPPILNCEGESCCSPECAEEANAYLEAR